MPSTTTAVAVEKPKIVVPKIWRPAMFDNIKVTQNFLFWMEKVAFFLVSRMGTIYSSDKFLKSFLQIFFEMKTLAFLSTPYPE